MGSALQLGFLGTFYAAHGDEPVSLPASRKTRAILAYLAVTGRSHTRARLCELFWDVADDPRAALRWTLSRLRALDEADAPHIIADRTSAAFEPAGAFVDVVEVRRAERAGFHTLSTDALVELEGLFRGPFLEDLDLPDLDGFEAWCIAERQALHGTHQALIRALLDRLTDEPQRAIPFARRFTEIAPSDEAARAALVALLAQAGHREEADAQYALAKHALERQGVTMGGALHAARATATQGMAAPVTTPEAPLEPPPEQDVRFCTSRDGTRLAYATLGQGPTLVKTAHWLTHIEHDWRNPLWRHISQDLAREYQLVRYDQRGTGLSDREVQDLSFDAGLTDLIAVLDAVKVPRFALLGISQGVRSAVAYAVRFPERVSHLVLYGGSATGWKHRGGGGGERRSALQTLIRTGWGMDNPAFRQVFTNLFMPEATPEQVQWFNELQRVSTSPETAVRLGEASGESDVSALLAEVKVPTLVMHATHDAVVPFEEGRAIAAGIDGARFVALESQNHMILGEEPAWTRFLSELRRFLR